MNGLDKAALDRWITREPPEFDDYTEPDDLPSQTDEEIAAVEALANAGIDPRIAALCAQWRQEPPDDEGCTPGGWAKSPI